MNEREKQILYTIISHYIKTGESVGSRTIEKKYDIGVSSATIRNAMADLEDMGFIHKTHTSSGRIPTEEGYKVYIDEIMESYDEVNPNEINSYIKFKSKQIGFIMENITEMLSKISETTVVSLEPSIEKHKINKIEIIFINEKRAYIVAVTELGIVKTANINFFNITTEKVLKELTKYINELIISNNYTYTLNELKMFLEKIGELDNGFSSKNDAKLRISNESKMLLHSDNIVETIKYMDNKNNIKELFKDIVSSDKYKTYEVNVIFGANLNIEELRNFVFIFFIYEYEGEKGLVSLIGPHRMNYKENIQYLSYIIDVLKQSLNNNMVIKLLS